MSQPEDREAELETLCRSCGMCCDGSLFRVGMLRPEEVEPARKLGLRIVEDRGFEQPCPKLVELSCTAYAERPSVCRSFTCELFARHQREGGPIAPRLAAVARVRELLATMKRHGMKRSADGKEMTFEADGGDAFAAMSAFSELMERIERDFKVRKPGA